MKLLILFIVFRFAAALVYQQSLIRVESRKMKMMKAGTWDAYHKEKQTLQQSFDDKYQNMNDFDDVEYIANLYIGTPPQAFKFYYDVNSQDFWVTDKSCEKFDSDIPHCPSICYKPGGAVFCNPKCRQNIAKTESDERICIQKAKYDSTKSSTFYHPNEPRENNRDYEFGYIVASFIGEDKIMLEAEAPKFGYLTVRLASFLQAKELSPTFADTPFDGMLGFGPSSFFLSNVNNKLDKPMYTIYINDIDDYNVTGGLITFGDIDKEHCSSEIEYQSTLSQYTFMIYNISFDTSPTEKQAMQIPSEVTVDIARSSIMGPPEIIKSLKEAANANEDGKIDCDAEIKDLSIQVRNENGFKILTIPGKHLKIQNPDGSCNIAFESMPPNSAFLNKWIFGVPWLKSYCNIFSFENEQKIGFSKIIV
uniref:Peptidase A1 domain-containing protein n=1 Tax=Panagrolaimus davidi TaxID=227884 RepID=A0A914PJD8_9BILA